MAADAFVLYSEGKIGIGNDTVQLSTHTFKAALFTSSYTPSISHTDYSTLTGEVSTGNGYTTGGITLTNVAITAQGTGFKFSSDPIAVTASGGDITGIRYLVIYDSTASGKTLIGYSLLDNTPANITVSNGTTRNIAPAATGWFTAA